MTPPLVLSTDTLLAHEAFVLRLARGLTRDESSAHDLAQDTWLSALSSPPGTHSLRGWLSTVLRNRAAERGRMEGRRKHREAAVARPESQDAPLPLERLELNQSVVRAVLALEEPYRGVVIAVYYEGLTPSAIAARDQISAGTVRSQLSRALEQLKGKLDTRHGERQAWCVPLLHLCAPKAAQTAAGATLPTAWWPSLGAAGVLAVGGLFGLAQLNGSGAGEAGADAALLPLSPSGHLSGGSTSPDAPSALSLLAQPSPAAKRAAIPPPTPAESQLPGLSDVPATLERVRQIKMVILDRALEVDPADLERFAWLKDLPNAGVTRLLDGVQYGGDFSLPWMRGGGSYFSFTENVHDFNRRPQISLFGDQLSASGREHVLLNLGPVPLESIDASPTWNGRELDAVEAAEFALAWTTVDPKHPELKTLADHRARAAKALMEGEETGSPEAQAFLRGGWGGRLRNGPERTFLMRVRKASSFDALVAFQVVRVEDDGCTLAWRILKTWPTDERYRLWKPRVERSAVPAPSGAMVAMTGAELRRELDIALEVADQQLFQTFSPEVEAKFGHLREKPECGVTRLLPYLGAWTELCNGFAHGSTVSPFDGDHNSQYTYLGFQGSGRHANLHPGLDGGVFGIVADIGKIDLETVTRASVTGLGGTAGDIALHHQFEQLAYEPNRAGFDKERHGLRQTNRNSFHAKLQEHKLRDTAVAVVGRTYLVRSVRFEDRDVLFAVHVAGLDEYGAILAWRILESEVAEPIQ